jgi:hypothetical protein
VFLAEPFGLVEHVLVRQEVMVHVDAAQRRRCGRNAAGERCRAEHRTRRGDSG